MQGKTWLAIGGVLSAVAAVMHLAIIIGGANWYRFFGAGERMARLAERGSPRPAIITLLIALVLFVWAGYAFSGAGLIPLVPLLRPGLVAISAIYLLRAAAFPIFLVYAPSLGRRFIYVSSAVVFAYGGIYAAGTWLSWPQLGEG